MLVGCLNRNVWSVALGAAFICWLEQVEAPLDESDPDVPEISAAIREGLEQAEAGLATPAEDYFEELRARHGLSR